MFLRKTASLSLFLSIQLLLLYTLLFFLIKISPKKELLVLLSTVVAVYKDNILHVYNSSMYFQKTCILGGLTASLSELKRVQCRQHIPNLCF